MTVKVRFNADEIRRELGVSFAESLEFIATSGSPISGSVMFHLGDEIDLTEFENIIIFCTHDTVCKSNSDNLFVMRAINPRHRFIEFLNRFVNNSISPYLSSGENEKLSFKHPTASAHPSVQLAPSSYVGPNCVLEEGVVLLPGAKLIENVHLGHNVVIGPGSVVGGWGFSVERRNDKPRSTIPTAGVSAKFPHFGGVTIGSGSNIGSLNTICSGTIEPTVLGERVMTDDHVHIAHNCKIYNDVCMAMHVALSGGVVIHENCWLGPSVSVLQKVIVGKESIIGMAANVLRNVEPFTTVVGNPAKVINN